MPSTLSAALFYARKGWPILPVWSVSHDKDGNPKCHCGDVDCRSVGKHPVTYFNGTAMAPGGVKEATTDIQTIRSWWKRYPNANIGAAGTKWFALDIDRANARLELAEIGRIPDTIESISGSGGVHIIFNHPKDFKVGNATGTLPNDVDVRGCNKDETPAGYILLPPSMHASGKRYEWEISSHPRDVDIADPPQWLVDILREANKQSRTRVAIEDVSTPDLAIYDISRTTRERILHGHRPGEDRSEKDMAVACALVEASASPGEIASIFHAHKIGTEGKMATHPNPESYLEHTISSAFSWTSAKTPKKVIPSKVQPGEMLHPEQAHNEDVALNLAYMQGWIDALANNPVMIDILWPEYMDLTSEAVRQWHIGADMEYKADDSENVFAALVVPYYHMGKVVTLDKTIYSPPEPHPHRIWESSMGLQVYDTVTDRQDFITGTTIVTGDWDEAIATVNMGLSGYEVLAQPASNLQTGSLKAGPRMQGLAEYLKDSQDIILCWPIERKREGKLLARLLEAGSERVRWASMPASLRDMYRIYKMNAEQLGRILDMSCRVNSI